MIINPRREGGNMRELGSFYNKEPGFNGGNGETERWSNDEL